MFLDIIGINKTEENEETKQWRRLESELRRAKADMVKIEEGLTSRNHRAKAKELFSVVKRVFKIYLSFEYEATFEELRAKIRENQLLDSELKDEISVFLSDVAILEYDSPDFNSILAERMREQEKLLRGYINDIEKEGGEVKDETKNKILKLVSDSFPHNEVEILLHMGRKFEEIIDKLVLRGLRGSA